MSTLEFDARSGVPARRIDGTPAGGVAIRDSSLLTTGERDALRESEQAANRRRRAREILERVELLEAQIHNTARRRSAAWAEAAWSESAAYPVTWPLAERLEDLYEAKRRLRDTRGLLV